eukprot:4171113-Pyramimonas_sp.AAC.1
MTIAQHELALSHLGISKNREDVKSCASQLPAAGTPFTAWWTELGKKKSTDQWIRKCKSLGTTEGQLEGKDVPAIGTLLYQHLDRDGEWAESPLQSAPVAA